MKKKTLIVLLIIPFVIGLVTFVSTVVLTNTIASDITDILWNYEEQEGFKIENGKRYKLEATPVSDPSILLASGNDLTWKLENIDGTSEVYATITQEDEEFYLTPLKEGSVKITCQNVRGTKAKSFIATIYEKGLITINPINKSSGSSIIKDSDIRTYGQYDVQYTSLDGEISKVTPEIKLNIKGLYDGNDISNFIVKNKTDNIIFTSDSSIKINGYGEASLTITSSGYDFLEATYKMNIIQDGYNIYNYNDLIKCTNKSDKNNPIVMQTSLQSLENTYKKIDNSYIEEFKNDGNNVHLFGNYDFMRKSFSFANEVSYVESSFSTDYIDQYITKNNTKQTKNIIAGINLKGNLYGNGFTINGNELCYPTNGKVGSSGILEPNSKKDLFLGPLPFVTIGNIDDSAIVKAYGEDNTLLYIANDNIAIDNCNIMNTNNVDDMYNLTYAGTVINVTKNNCTISNSILSNAKNIVHAYSSDNLTIDNCILKNGCEFLLEAGSNNYYKPNEDQTNLVINGDTKDVTGNFEEVFAPKNGVDEIITNFLSGEISNKEKVYTSLNQIQGYLDINSSKYLDATINVKDTKFSNSGIFSIALATMFNGTYLYNGTPSFIGDKLGNMILAPDKVGASSLPIKVNLIGNTDFYDFKDVDKIDIRCLLSQRIGEVFATYVGDGINLDIDTFFPMKSILKDIAIDGGYTYKVDNKQYLNTMIAYYGGGRNDSILDISKLDEGFSYSDNIIVDILRNNLDGKYQYSNAENPTLAKLINALAKCVLAATGFHPFKFNVNTKGDYSNYDKVPTIEDLKSNINEGEE